jgi:hypothetical protein
MLKSCQLISTDFNRAPSHISTCFNSFHLNPCVSVFWRQNFRKNRCPGLSRAIPTAPTRQAVAADGPLVCPRCTLGEVLWMPSAPPSARWSGSAKICGYTGNTAEHAAHRQSIRRLSPKDGSGPSRPGAGPDGSQRDQPAGSGLAVLHPCCRRHVTST